MKIISVVGARPNFMKIAPLIRVMDAYNSGNGDKIEHLLVHTGQHYDERMSSTFFEELGIPDPDINLEIGSGSHAEQIGHTMIAFEKVIRAERPDWIILLGDVNATLACSVVAKKEGISCCHIEAGLRSGDIRMPEEINRLVTDRLSDLLLTPDKISSGNLLKEGIDPGKIVFVGNIMIDTLEANREKAASFQRSDIYEANVFPGNEFKLADFQKPGDFGLVTMHRPSNVDDAAVFSTFVDWLTQEASEQIALVWPIHPRAVKQAQAFGLWEKLMRCRRLLLLYPIGYLEMLKLNMDARIMLTDSGGLQEECCVLGTPFLTFRWNTERPITLMEHGGAGCLVGNAISTVKKEFEALMQEDRKPSRPELWDGKTAERCLKALLEYAR